MSLRRLFRCGAPPPSTPTPTPTLRPAHPTPTVTGVTDLTSLQAALTSAYPAGGVVIGCAAGSYGSLFLAGKNYTSDVWITSIDPNNPAVFDQIDIREQSTTPSSHIKVDGVKIDGSSSIGTAATNIFQVRGGSTNCGIQNSEIVGRNKSTTGDGWHWGYLVNISGAAGNVFVNFNYIHQGQLGINLDTVTDIDVLNNKIRDFNNQGGIKALQVQRLNVKNNGLGYFDAAAGSHWDPIQVYTSGATASSTDMVFDNNMFYQGPTCSVGISEGITSNNNGGVGAFPSNRVQMTNNIGYGDCPGMFVARYNNNLTLTGNQAFYVPLAAGGTSSNAGFIVSNCTGTQGNNGASSGTSSQFDTTSTMTALGGNFVIPQTTDAVAIAALNAFWTAQGW